MKIDHVHFYVEDARACRDWFAQTLGFQAVAAIADSHTLTEVVQQGSIYFALSSPLSTVSPVAQFLQQHPPGVVDVAFLVEDLATVMAQAIAQEAKVLEPRQQQPVQQQLGQGCLQWGQIAAWGNLRHTLVQRSGLTSLLPLGLESALVRGAMPWVSDPALSQPQGQVREQGKEQGRQVDASEVTFTQIDHAVLNVGVGELEPAIAWYEKVLGFQPQQQFAIQTKYSGLRSQVLVHPEGGAQLPINEPTSASSQIQEFLDLNRGPGIQHIALQTDDIVAAIAQLRQRELSLLSVPTTYYTQLQQRPGFDPAATDWQAVTKQQILVDWQSEVSPALLLQTFTQPIFRQPTFFFEVIERQVYRRNGQAQKAQGFGEGNFRALFEAVEREQMRRRP
ncbi:MAG: VOC family protein [Trichocoleus desertorum ATA4-8-CV12]|jgi:4-hydroxyphenylpyruvate dioxygenase|nr:VOC family protein [Trichocoleus desertorum ATA4-8-CV12]